MKGWDGFYHKSLIDNASRYACNFKFDYEENLKTTELILADAGNLARAQKGRLQLTIDRAEEQHKIHLEETSYFSGLTVHFAWPLPIPGAGRM